jgi:hypothetical protein
MKVNVGTELEIGKISYVQNSTFTNPYKLRILHFYIQVEPH